MQEALNSDCDSGNSSRHEWRRRDQPLGRLRPPFPRASVLASVSCQSQNPGSEILFPHGLFSLHFHGDTESRLSDLAPPSVHWNPSFIQRGCLRHSPCAWHRAKPGGYGSKQNTRLPSQEKSLAPWSRPAGGDALPHPSTITRPLCGARGEGAAFALLPSQGNGRHPEPHTGRAEATLLGSPGGVYGTFQQQLGHYSPKSSRGKVRSRKRQSSYPNKHTPKGIIPMEPATPPSMNRSLKS